MDQITATPLTVEAYEAIVRIVNRFWEIDASDLDGNGTEAPASAYLNASDALYGTWDGRTAEQAAAWMGLREAQQRTLDAIEAAGRQSTVDALRLAIKVDRDHTDAELRGLVAWWINAAAARDLISAEDFATITILADTVARVAD